LVAFSLAGEQRDLVKAVAKEVERRLGESTVFYDEWFEHYLAGPDADLRLQRIYSRQCELVVICISGAYDTKPWTRTEHQVVRARYMAASGSEPDCHRVLAVRVGDGEVEGINLNCIVPDLRSRSSAAAAQLVLDRLQLVWPANLRTGDVAGNVSFASPQGRVDPVPTAGEYEASSEILLGAPAVPSLPSVSRETVRVVEHSMGPPDNVVPMRKPKNSRTASGRPLSAETRVTGPLDAMLADVGVLLDDIRASSLVDDPALLAIRLVPVSKRVSALVNTLDQLRQRKGSAGDFDWQNRVGTVGRTLEELQRLLPAGRAIDRAARSGVSRTRWMQVASELQGALTDLAGLV
jgi:hypothetical protein